MYTKYAMGYARMTYAQEQAVEWLNRRAEQGGWEQSYTSYLLTPVEFYGYIERTFYDGDMTRHFCIYADGTMDIDTYKTRKGERY